MSWCKRFEKEKEKRWSFICVFFFCVCLQAMEMGFEAQQICKCLRENPKVETIYDLTEKLLEQKNSGPISGFAQLATNFGPVLTAAAFVAHKGKSLDLISTCQDFLLCF